MMLFRGVSSDGRAPAWHAGGQRFESATLHGGLAQVVERQNRTLEVSGSSPLPSTFFFGGLAQMVERQHGMLKVSGSSPLPSTGERCRSGRTGTTGNRVVRQKRARGFESPPLRILSGGWGLGPNELFRWGDLSVADEFGRL